MTGDKHINEGKKSESKESHLQGKAEQKTDKNLFNDAYSLAENVAGSVLGKANVETIKTAGKNVEKAVDSVAGTNAFENVSKFMKDYAVHNLQGDQYGWMAKNLVEQGKQIDDLAKFGSPEQIRETLVMNNQQIEAYKKYIDTLTGKHANESKLVTEDLEPHHKAP